MREEENKDLRKLFKEFGWISTDLNTFIEQANRKTVIEESK